MLLKHIEKFVQSLKDIFEINIEENRENLLEKQEIKILNLYLDEFWQYLENSWQDLDNIAIDFYQSCLNYQSTIPNWNIILEDSENLSEIDFILKHSQYRSSIAQLKSDNKLDDDYIQFEMKEILKNPPKIINNDDLNKFKRFGLYSFKLYENSPLKINLHLRLNKGISFNFLILFSLTIEYPKKEQEFSMAFINDYYQSSIILYELQKFYYELGYSVVENYYANREKYISDDLISKNKTNEFYNITQNDLFYNQFSKSSSSGIIINPPIEFKAFYLNLLHNSPYELFLHLSSNLNKINNIIEKYSKILNPKSYYDSFEFELKDFLEKGKKLFSKSEELVYEKLTPEKKIEYKIPKKKKVTQDKVYDLLLKEYDVDIKQGKESGNAGFRSKKEFFDKYKKQLNVSQGTFYKYLTKIISKSNNFEKRERQKSGGGEEFRVIIEEKKDLIKVKRLITQMSLPPSDHYKESYEYMVKFEEAMFYYADDQYNMAKTILKKIYSAYPEQLKIDSFIYSQLLNHLGDVYFKIGKLDKALNYFKEGDELVKESRRDLFEFKVEMLKIKRWEGDYSNLFDEIIDLEKRIQTLFEFKLKKINEDYNFVDNSKIEDLDIYHISKLKSDPNFRRIQPFLEIITLELNLLKINFLKLDLLRRKIILESTRNPIKEIEQNRKIVKVIPNEIKELLNEAYKIIELSLKIKFNREHNFSLPFNLFKHYFDNIKNIVKIPFSSDQYIFDFEPVCPLYYFRFLKAIVNTEPDNQIHECLSKDDIDRLDAESQIEYYIKLSQYELETPFFRVNGQELINLFTNLKTLMDYTIYLGEKINASHLINLAKEAKIKLIEERELLEKSLKESRERFKRPKKRG